MVVFFNCIKYMFIIIMTDYYYKYIKKKSQYHILKNDTNYHLDILDTFADKNLSFAINFTKLIENAGICISPILVLLDISFLSLFLTDEQNVLLNKIMEINLDLQDITIINGIFDSRYFTVVRIINNYMLAFTNHDITNKIISKSGYNIIQDTNKINERIYTDTNSIIKNAILDNKEEIILSVIYVKPIWYYKFDAIYTFVSEFHKNRGDNIELMKQKNEILYYENTKYQIIELQFSDIRYSMGIILPKKYLEEVDVDFSIHNVPQLSYDEMRELINNLSLTHVELYIPKFSVEERINVSDYIYKSGIDNIFEKMPNIHQIARISINEDGIKESSINNSVTYKLFSANHIFVYYIRYVPNDIIILNGDYQG
jgi:serine protease inhibitor